MFLGLNELRDGEGPTGSRISQPRPRPTARDDEAEAQSRRKMNLYAYVANDPVNLIDPTGLQDECGGSACPVVTGERVLQLPNGAALLGGHSGANGAGIFAGLGGDGGGGNSSADIPCDPQTDPEHCAVVTGQRPARPRSVPSWPSTSPAVFRLAQGEDIRQDRCITTGHLCTSLFPNTEHDRRQCAAIQRNCQAVRRGFANDDGKNSGTEICARSSDGAYEICVTIRPPSGARFGNVLGIVYGPVIRRIYPDQ